MGQRYQRKYLCISSNTFSLKREIIHEDDTFFLKYNHSSEIIVVHSSSISLFFLRCKNDNGPPKNERSTPLTLSILFQRCLNPFQLVTTFSALRKPNLCPTQNSKHIFQMTILWFTLIFQRAKTIRPREFAPRNRNWEVFLIKSRPLSPNL